MTKGPLLQEIWDQLPEARKQRIRARTAELDAEYRTLRGTARGSRITQSGVSKDMKMPQSNISRLEKSSDMLLSTLRSSC